MTETERLFTISKHAQSLWATLSPQKRASQLLTFRETFINRIDETLKLISTHTERPFPCLSGEALTCVEQISYDCKTLPKKLESKISKNFNLLLFNQKTFVHKYPLGTLLFTGSSDTPLLAILTRLIPALIAGNSVLLASGGPLHIERAVVEMALESGLPNGLIQAVHIEKEGSLREILYQHPDKVFYWGTEEHSKQLLSLAAESHVPVQTDLLPLRISIVLPDADLEMTTSALLSSAAARPSIISKKDLLFVHERILESFMSLLNKKTALLKGSTELNTRIIESNEPKNIAPFRIVADLISQINQSADPLHISIFSKNLHFSHDIGKQLRSSFVFVNDAPYTAEPFSLYSQSFVREQKIRLPKLSLFQFKSPWWLPYSHFQFQAFRFFLDLYRRGFSSRIKAVPLVLWNMIQMLKNEKRL